MVVDVVVGSTVVVVVDVVVGSTVVVVLVVVDVVVGSAAVLVVAGSVVVVLVVVGVVVGSVVVVLVVVVVVVVMTPAVQCPDSLAAGGVPSITNVDHEAILPVESQPRELSSVRVFTLSHMANHDSKPGLTELPPVGVPLHKKLKRLLLALAVTKRFAIRYKYSTSNCKPGWNFLI